MAVRYATIKPVPIRDQLSFHKCQVMQRNGSNPSCPTARPGTTARLSPIQALLPPLTTARTHAHHAPRRAGYGATHRLVGPRQLGSAASVSLRTMPICGVSASPVRGHTPAIHAIRQTNADHHNRLCWRHLSLVRRRWLDGPAAAAPVAREVTAGRRPA
jgi:hypothetical protein